MTTKRPIIVRSRGLKLDTSHDCFGALRNSIDALDDADLLRQRMVEDGYLYLPGLLSRADVLSAKYSILQRLNEQNLLEPGFPLEQGRAREGIKVAFKPDLARQNPDLDKVLYQGPIMDFYERFLGGAVRHFDYTWFRAVAPGFGTNPHCDLVYMSRGTPKLYTAWVPIGDIDLEMGGLMILEKSHLKQDQLRNYLSRDVDAYCTNHARSELFAKGQKKWDGALTKNSQVLRQKLGGRWLTAEFRAGDLLTFGMCTVHASLDNQSKFFRLSSDSRYQLASEPADHRWVGPQPIGHSMAAQQGRIC